MEYLFVSKLSQDGLAINSINQQLSQTGALPCYCTSSDVKTGQAQVYQTTEEDMTVTDGERLICDEYNMLTSSSFSVFGLIAMGFSYFVVLWSTLSRMILAMLVRCIKFSNLSQ